MMRGEALRYLGWQFRDRTLPRLVACLVIATALGLPMWVATRGGRVPPPAQVAMMFDALHGQLTYIFALLFAGGLIAQDRVQGWYRFYLAKPVSPVWFYGQAIVLALLGMVLASAAYMGIFSVAVAPYWRWGALGEAALIFALPGMLVVAWSSVIRHDWVAGVATLVVVSLTRQLVPPDTLWHDVVLAVLPPAHLLTFTPPPSGGQIAWIVGWALGLLALTLTILRRRPMGEG